MYRAMVSARQLRIDGIVPVTSPARYREWHRRQLADGVVEVTETPRAVAAVINHGRWIAHCPQCTTGMWVHPGWDVACCVECGAVYAEVRFPPHRAQIEAALLARPRRANQNWEPGETLADLARQNAEHGCPT